tara:strand:+ start:63 stop:482 length:420 start_codon:yes stop_codon:yes gene_type:complete
MSKNSPSLDDSKLKIFAFWIVRLTLGLSFFFHGWGKLPLPPEKLTAWFDSMEMIYPDIIASLVSLGEIGAGIGIILGGFISGSFGAFVTRLSAFSIFVIMTGAFYLAHSDWFINENLFKSEQIYIFVLSIFFLVNGNNK